MTKSFFSIGFFLVMAGTAMAQTESADHLTRFLGSAPTMVMQLEVQTQPVTDEDVNPYKPEFVTIEPHAGNHLTLRNETSQYKPDHTQSFDIQIASIEPGFITFELTDKNSRLKAMSIDVGYDGGEKVAKKYPHTINQYKIPVGGNIVFAEPKHKNAYSVRWWIFPEQVAQ